MKTTERFDTAVTQLYTAFNEGTLNAFDCQACAVGNMVNSSRWIMNMRGESGKLLLKEYVLSHGLYNPPKHKDYTEQELYNIERIFLQTFIEAEDYMGIDKNLQYKGLMSVIKYLAKLDNITIPKITVEQFKAVLV